jgi:hypothetical protein
MPRSTTALTIAELRRCAQALRLLAERRRADAALPENASRREDLEIDAQESQDLSAKCMRLAIATRTR